jgi:hypothetical protein
VLVGVALPKSIMYASQAISDYLQYRTDEYCKTSSLENCVLAREYNNHLSPMLGVTLGVGTATAFIAVVSNSSPILKTVETAISSMLELLDI